MSLLKPDIHYDPAKEKDMYVTTKNTAFVPDIPSINPITSKEEFHKNLLTFMNNFEDMDFIRFYNISKMTFKTSINVQDSVSFFEKLMALYIGSLKKLYPQKDWEELEKSTLIIQKFLAESLKHDNVENKFLLPMILGITEGLLNYENY